jgi:hypothetical protein
MAVAPGIVVSAGAAAKLSIPTCMAWVVGGVGLGLAKLGEIGIGFYLSGEKFSDIILYKMLNLSII